MHSLKSETSESILQLGNHQVYDVQQVHGLDTIPDGIDGSGVLSLELPSIPIRAAGIEVGAREFYLCYAPKQSLLFVVETEMAKQVEKFYRPQYGANDNYATSTKVWRIVWIYPADSDRAKDTVIANHLKWYLPNQK